MQLWKHSVNASWGPSHTDMNETENEIRLRRAKEFLTTSREQENQARITLARAAEQTKRAKEKYETLFSECEKQAAERIKTQTN